MENRVIHKASTRGHADHGWLDTYHTFSFANYYDPQRVNFGRLRVLNDDTVAPGMGFGTHPHDNMEIISIPLEGDLEHRDSMGNVQVIRKGDVQVMSAGTGITHSEYNRNGDKPVKFLQIWVIPNKANVSPRYDQITTDPQDRKNRFQQIVSPSPNDEGAWINQNAWFSLGHLDKGVSLEYNVKDRYNGVYIFVLSGTVTVNGTPGADGNGTKHQAPAGESESETLDARDGMGVWDTERLTITADSEAEVLLMDVPMR